MRLLLILATFFSALMSCWAQERKMQFFAPGEETPFCEWNINTRCILEFNSQTGTFMYNHGTGHSVARPVVWLSEVNHIGFAYDPSEVTTLADAQAEWRISVSPDNYLVVTAPQSIDGALFPLPLTIYNMAGSVVGGMPHWDGSHIRIAYLAPGEYLVGIGNIVTLKFIKL